MRNQKTNRIVVKCNIHVQGYTNILSGFPFIDHKHPDNILESLCTIYMVAVLNKLFHYFNAVYLGNLQATKAH
jgi:hypothetical protein